MITSTSRSTWLEGWWERQGWARQLACAPPISSYSLSSSPHTTLASCHSCPFLPPTQRSTYCLEIWGLYVIMDTQEARMSGAWRVQTKNPNTTATAHHSVLTLAIFGHSLTWIVPETVKIGLSHAIENSHFWTPGTLDMYLERVKMALSHVLLCIGI